MHVRSVHGALNALAKSHTNHLMQLQISEINSAPKRLLNPLPKIWLGTCIRTHKRVLWHDIVYLWNG